MQIQTFNNTNINFQKYSPEVIKMMESKVESLYSKKMSPNEIAKILDTTEAFVRKSLQKLRNIERSQKVKQLKVNNIEKKEVRINKRLSLGLEIFNLKKQGLTIKEIAKKLNRSEPTIRGHLQLYKVNNLEILV